MGGGGRILSILAVDGVERHIWLGLICEYIGMIQV